MHYSKPAFCQNIYTGCVRRTKHAENRIIREKDSIHFIVLLAVSYNGYMLHIGSCFAPRGGSVYHRNYLCIYNTAIIPFRFYDTSPFICSILAWGNSHTLNTEILNSCFLSNLQKSLQTFVSMSKSTMMPKLETKHVIPSLLYEDYNAM